MFPRVSCSEKPITAVKTAEVVIKPVKLTSEIQRKLGFAVQPLAAANRAAQIDGYLRVLDPGPLAQLESDIEVAQATAEASSAEAARTRALNAADQAASNKALEAAIAQASGDASKLALLRQRLSLEWGPGIGRMSATTRLTSNWQG